MPVPNLPLAAWNSHMHCFDPERFPFKRTRAYTSQPAVLKDLIQNSRADNVMLVQATIEDGYTGLLEHLQQCRDIYPEKHIRGTIFWDPGDPGLKTLTEFEFGKLHDLGIRSVRIHGSYGGSGDDASWVIQQFEDVASHCPLRRYNWSISAQLPLTTWPAIAETLTAHPGLKEIPIIVDHNGSATPSGISTPEFTSLLHLLSSPNMYIKLGALHQRSNQISQMEHVIKAIAKTAPDSILWGSDWPHCNAAIRGLTPTPPLEVDTDQELELLRDWLTEEQWEHDVTVFRTTGEEVENVPTKQLTLLDTYRSYTPEFSKETEAQLVRKIDLRLLPLIVTIYLFNYLDRNSITQARLYGLQEDTHVKGATYQTAISIFSAGYIMIPAGLLIVRFILGIVEAPFFPGAIYYLSTWYTKKELGIRMALLVSGILLSNCFAGLISAGILSGMAGVGHLAAWRWLFILEGLATVVIGVVAFFLLPDYPGTTSWLTEEEKVVAQGRLAVDAGSEEILGEEEITMKQAILSAVRDYRVWLFACLQMSTTASISFSHFFPTLIKQLGFKNNTIVLLLTAPPYLFSFIWSLSFAWDADRRQKRSPHAAISGLTAIAATIALVAVIDQKWPRYALTFLVSAGTFGIYSTTYPWLSSTIVQPRVKRAASIGIANTLANSASLFANYFWLDQYGPDFRVSWSCILAFQGLGFVCIMGLRYSLKRANKAFDELSATVDETSEESVNRLDKDSQRAVLNGFRFIT
ncbi:hypothetical protein FGADI_7529 [Fusarium gaditjirri]|uniref:Amidohydrolase-related domain-containing protein n=1 Tax=Fusarium gaditjirri TaxID=282569 RepID=A0A8H4WVG1_9HYPO|nr:hypothetical protein FGADI_7529 [Fusarium gaditjirri]